jgi:hypothetical protein
MKFYVSWCLRLLIGTYDAILIKFHFSFPDLLNMLDTMEFDLVLFPS